MSELSELYQAVILDHNKKPRNFHKLETANRSAEGFNPLCGDQLHVYLQVEGEGDRVNDISFEGTGCAIWKASASMMTQAVKGKSRAEAEILFDEFHGMVPKAFIVLHGTHKPSDPLKKDIQDFVRREHTGNC